MSVLISGMEMPDRCFSCPLCNIEPDGESLCAKSLGPAIEYKEIDVKTAINTRPDWCPLIPVPPHGRLIDADEFYKDINESVLLTDGFKDAFNLWFDEQPTIIPAEEGKG